MGLVSQLLFKIIYLHSGLSPQPEDTVAPGLYQTLDYTCNDLSEILLNTSSNTFTITCGIFPLDIGESFERFVRKRTLVIHQSQSEVIKVMLYLVSHLKIQILNPLNFKNSYF